MPKNYNLQPEPALGQVLGLPDVRGYTFDVQIVTAPVTDGSLSSCPPAEAVTWGKVDKDTYQQTTESMQADYSMVMPFLVKALLDNRDRYARRAAEIGEEALFEEEPKAAGYLRSTRRLPPLRSPGDAGRRALAERRRERRVAAEDVTLPVSLWRESDPMSKTTVTLLPGDGIGPEVSNAAVRVFDAAGAEIEWERHIAGAEALEKFGNPLPPEVLESIRRNRLALKGPITTQVGKGFKSINVQLRQELDLYANLRPARSLASIPSRFEGVDLVVVRENTEDLYSGLEHIVVPGVVESLKIITEKASPRIARFAFEYARRHGRKRVTAVHKANIMKLSDGLFLDCFRRGRRGVPRDQSRTTGSSTTCACSWSCVPRSATCC